MVSEFDLNAEELDSFSEYDVKADLCITPSLMQRSRTGLQSSRLMMYRGTWLLLPDYMMDWLAETDKENDIATACQENQERDVVGVTVR